MSRRGIHLPTTRYSLGSLSRIFLRSSSDSVLVIGTFATMSPYAIDRPVGRWRTTPRSAVQSSGETFQYRAAASTSMIRAAAPARDSASNVQFTDQLPPVSMSPYFGSLIGYSFQMSFQSPSLPSAPIWE